MPSELVRARKGKYKADFKHYVPRGALRFTHWGISYVRTRSRDAIDLPIFVREPQPFTPNEQGRA